MTACLSLQRLCFLSARGELHWYWTFMKSVTKGRTLGPNMALKADWPEAAQSKV